MTAPKSRILVHDYSGHAFAAQLSRELAARGHIVVHAYSKSFVTPHGALQRRDGDAATLSFAGLSLGEVLDKQALVKRWWQERRYGALLSSLIRDVKPDIVLSGNSPLDPQARALSAARRAGAGFVFWMQDIVSVGITSVLNRRLGPVGRMIGWHYRKLEADIVRRSDAVVVITEDFVPVIKGWGLDPSCLSVIPNWASMEEIPRAGKRNVWSLRHGLDERFCFIYSGTLGMKHNPELLFELAASFSEFPEVRVIVVSEGAGADWLIQKKARHGLRNLEVLPFQPYEDLASVLGAADILLAILEPEAGVFSVPSKVLSYLCAGRPLLLAVPRENLAARIVIESGAGEVVDPTDPSALVAQAKRFYRNGSLREVCGEKAIHYARLHFDVKRVTDQFENIFAAAMERRS